MTKAKATTKSASRRPVLVTTAHRGVFVGYATSEEKDGQIELSDARMIVYWPASNKGVLGVATEGPKDGSRVSPAVSKMRLKNVTAVIDATSAAAAAWERGPWS